MSNKRSKNPDSMPVALRIPKDMAKKVRIVSDKSRLSDADVMRLAIERGLGQVEKMFETQEAVAA